MNKFGKSLDDIFKIKKNFLTENNSLLVNQNEIARVYNMQPEREFCVVCGKKLDRNVCFESHNVKYCICAVCGHVNGIHMDTKEFADKVYIQQDYGKNYRAEHTQYQERIEKIYKPKVDFLIEALGGGVCKKKYAFRCWSRKRLICFGSSTGGDKWKGCGNISPAGCIWKQTYWKRGCRLYKTG